MMDEEDFSSDTSDEDYMPTGEGEAVSEDDYTSGDDDLGAEGETDKNSSKKKKGKGKKKASKSLGARKRQGGITLEGEEEESISNKKEEETDDFNKQLGEQIIAEKQEAKEQNEKQKADSLWADFMKDVGGPKPKPKTPSAASPGLGTLSKPITASSSTTKPQSSSVSSLSSSKDKPQKVTITQEFDFAGEVVKVTKEVDANSKEAKAEQRKEEKAEAKGSPGISGIPSLKRPGGGLGSVLGMINKKTKISTLEKSKLDWNMFKSEEGIEEELGSHNRGKDGYLERMAFLERTDQRQFEIEKNIRLSNSKR